MKSQLFEWVWEICYKYKIPCVQKYCHGTLLKIRLFYLFIFQSENNPQHRFLTENRNKHVLHCIIDKQTNDYLNVLYKTDLNKIIQLLKSHFTSYLFIG